MIKLMKVCNGNIQRFLNMYWSTETLDNYKKHWYSCVYKTSGQSLRKSFEVINEMFIFNSFGVFVSTTNGRVRMDSISCLWHAKKSGLTLAVLGIFFIRLFPNWIARTPTTYTNDINRDSPLKRTLSMAHPY